MTDEAQATIRRVLSEQGRLREDPQAISSDADLAEAGMSSHASVNVMLGLEDAFDIEFPDRMLRREYFESINAIAAAIAELQQEEASV